MKLEDIRQEINAIDEEMVKLFVRRMQAADAVADAKRGSGKSVFDPARERDILAKVSRTVGPELESEAKLFFTTLMSISRSRQRADLAEGTVFAKFLADAVTSTADRFPSTVSVACPGAEGGYSQQAVCAMVQTPTIFYFRDFDAVFSAVGSVTPVYDLMAKHDFKIVKAMKLRIRHVLLAPHGAKLADVREVTSHPYALAQCSEYLKSRPDVRQVPAANTAVAAAELAKSGRTDAAVIASRECAELYGLDILEEDISDIASNYTRFVCISRNCAVYPDADKVSLMMGLGHRPGALSDVLVKFAAVGVNLTKLESRPVPGSDFEYRFIFDFEASLRDSKIVRLLSGFATDPEIEHFNFLGAYAEK